MVMMEIGRVRPTSVTLLGILNFGGAWSFFEIIRVIELQHV
jgi:hypothetical protein